MWQVWASCPWGTARDLSLPGGWELFPRARSSNEVFQGRASAAVDGPSQEAPWEPLPMGPSCAPGRLPRGAAGPERLLVRGVVPVGAERTVLVWRNRAWAQVPRALGARLLCWRPPAFPAWPARRLGFAAR